MRVKHEDMIGREFTRLKVMRDTGQRQSSGRHVVWECECQCGNTTFVTTCNLMSGNTKSCGCLRVENAAKAREARRARREESH